ncbi:MAG TPA: glycogen debranching N-terminal domain-containing protein [Candidatus Limnocylindrales bacterium]
MTASSAVLAYSGYSVLCCSQDGSMGEGTDGLYDFDTRIVSRYRLLVDGRAPEIVSWDQPESDRWEAVLEVPIEGGSAAGPLLPQDAIELVVARRLGPVMFETVRVRNRSGVGQEVRLTIEIDGDFADVAEVGRQRQQVGTVERSWSPECVLLIAYRAEHEGRSLERGLRLRFGGDRVTPEPTEDGVGFPLVLEPGREWSLSVSFESLVDGVWRVPEPGDRRHRQRGAWRRTRPSVDSPGALRVAFERACDDLFDLRNWELEDRYLGSTDGGRWVINAGLPRFTGFFGRDTLTAGWQSAMVGSRAARGALAVATATQSETDDPWRDAEPGKMIHEIRAGPLADLRILPRDAYYGTQTTPAMFLLALSDVWHWTGDRDALQAHRDSALRALDWAERFGDRDGDGFLEYLRRSPKGLRNQGWKDSDEAIRYPDGRLVDGPIATVEEQAFHFVALQRMAEILVALGEDDRARAFRGRARVLREEWHDAFWMPGEQYYALALDGEKRQVRSITSNPGHALATAIVPPAHAPAVAERLLSPELFSGWGVRTISNQHPSFNPFAYHLGAVWPVEQATFALGMKRYGLDAQAERLIGAVLEAASSCPGGRLPEALSGHERGDLSHPVLYPEANSPQAWSSSAVIQLVQIMLGIYPFAPLGVLALVRPRLPDWIPELTIRRLRVGSARIDLRFTRRADGSADHQVLRREGRLLVVTGGPPQPAGREAANERVKRVLLERLPGEAATMVRLALGID